MKNDFQDLVYTWTRGSFFIEKRKKQKKKKTTAQKKSHNSALLAAVGWKATWIPLIHPLLLIYYLIKTSLLGFWIGERSRLHGFPPQSAPFIIGRCTQTYCSYISCNCRGSTPKVGINIKTKSHVWIISWHFLTSVAPVFVQSVMFQRGPISAHVFVWF